MGRYPFSLSRLQVFPSLPEDLLKEYVNIYEEAVFSPHKFTAVEYRPLSTARLYAVSRLQFAVY
jgi:hypothetical protein